MRIEFEFSAGEELLAAKVCRFVHDQRKAIEDEKSGVGRTRVDQAVLTLRTANALKAAGIVFIEDAQAMTDRELLQNPGIGRMALNEIRECGSYTAGVPIR